jgi:hypothetical protein
MPAKVGPKRVRALALEGCYFDGTAAVWCAGREFDLRKARRLRPYKWDFRACVWEALRTPRSRHIIASEAKQSIFSHARRRWIASRPRNDGG